ncbi:hypothetical protein C8A05DRAFT_11388 [Staphylotrichum tortipilum]|uniref:Uncharacterized protein n=1 Tax=Staphylotrichum tortipilum TaxID=2831512 RepID=A0AAN6MUL2_9PEZI|nr:hypothetical protein C8A05DRAFT_11388 [Staphylotrichum longicolle]
MRAFGHRRDDSWTSFGHHRGISGDTRLGLDLTRTRADSDGAAAGPGSYPSPPMSGSPPLPLKIRHEVAEPSQGTYQATPHDVSSGAPTTTQSEERAHPGVPSGHRPFLSETTSPADRPSYAFPPRLDPPGPRPLSYPPPLSHGAPQPAPYLSGPAHGTALSHTGHLPAPQGYPAASHHPIPESLHNTPPKPQRKTKGHVASACVPCKKAHLRFVPRRLCPSIIKESENMRC